MDVFQLDLGQQVHAVSIERQPLGAQRDLLGRFLAADIKHSFVRREMRQRLQQQGGFADAGVAADQHHRALHQTAAQHAVEFDDAGRGARHFRRFNLGKSLHPARRRQRAETVLPARGNLCDTLNQGVPCAAVRALPLPLGYLPAAFRAGVNRFWFCHVCFLFGFYLARRRKLMPVKLMPVIVTLIPDACNCLFERLFIMNHNIVPKWHKIG